MYALASDKFWLCPSIGELTSLLKALKWLQNIARSKELEASNFLLSQGINIFNSNAYFFIIVPIRTIIAKPVTY